MFNADLGRRLFAAVFALSATFLICAVAYAPITPATAVLA